MYKVLFFKRNSVGIILEIPTCKAKSACAQPCKKPGLSMLHLYCHRPQIFTQENKSVQNFGVVGAAIIQRENNSFPSFSTWSFWMEMSMGLFFCTFPCFSYRGSSSSRLLGCVFHSHLPCSASALTPGWSGKPMAFSGLADPSHLPTCHGTEEPASFCSRLSGFLVCACCAGPLCRLVSPFLDSISLYFCVGEELFILWKEVRSCAEI